MSDTVGLEIGGGRFTTLTAALKRILDDPTVVGPIAEGGRRGARRPRPMLGQRVPTPFPDRRCRIDAGRPALAACRRPRTRCAPSTPMSTRPSSASCAPSSWPPGCRRPSTSRSASWRATWRSWAAGPTIPRLEIAPLDVGPTLATGVWARRTAILTSATIPSSLAATSRPARRRVRRHRRRQPVRLRAPRAALLRAPHARPALAAVRRGRARRTGGADHRRRRPHAGAVHQLEGDGRRGRGGEGAGRRTRSSPSATCPRPRW